MNNDDELPPILNSRIDDLLIDNPTMTAIVDELTPMIDAMVDDFAEGVTFSLDDSMPEDLMDRVTSRIMIELAARIARLS